MRSAMRIALVTPFASSSRRRSTIDTGHEGTGGQERDDQWHGRRRLVQIRLGTQRTGPQDVQRYLRRPWLAAGNLDR